MYKKLLLAAVAVLALAGSAHAMTPEERNCIFKSEEIVRTFPSDKALDWLILDKGTEADIYDHYLDPKTKIKWAFISSRAGDSDFLRYGWVKRSMLQCS
jgi:hypothetical protein